MSLTTAQKENIVQALKKQYGFVKSELAADLYVSPTTGALLFWDGDLFELSCGLCEEFKRGNVILR